MMQRTIYLVSDSHSDGCNTVNYFSTNKKAKLFARESNKEQWRIYLEMSSDKDMFINKYAKDIWESSRFSVYSILLDPEYKVGP